MCNQVNLQGGGAHSKLCRDRPGPSVCSTAGSLIHDNWRTFCGLCMANVNNVVAAPGFLRREKFQK